MSFEACAQIVEKGDPDRFLAAMAAPVPLRRVLFPIYAFNVEVARAPWASEEPLIAEMRLQWWADALEEIASGGKVRRHEVTEPLAGVIDADIAGLLISCVDARRRDARRERVQTDADLRMYLAQTSGGLHVAAMRAAGVAGHDDRAMAVGSALGLANYLMAVPEFLRRNINPLPELTQAQMVSLLNDHREMLRGGPNKASKTTRAVDLVVWRAHGVLSRALKDQSAIVDGRLGGSEFGRRAGLLWRGLRA